MMQQNPADEDRDNLEIGATVSGKIIRVTPEGILVSLPGGNTGVLSVDLPGVDVENDERFRADAVVNVQIVSKEANKRFRLAQVFSQETARPDDAFDKEFHRLRNMLANGPVKTTATVRHQPEEPFEESLKDWIQRVETSLPFFHKNRSKRLRTALNDREKDGGR